MAPPMLSTSSSDAVVHPRHHLPPQLPHRASIHDIFFCNSSPLSYARHPQQHIIITNKVIINNIIVNLVRKIFINTKFIKTIHIRPSKSSSPIPEQQHPMSPRFAPPDPNNAHATTTCASRRSRNIRDQRGGEGRQYRAGARPHSNTNIPCQINIKPN